MDNSNLFLLSLLDVSGGRKQRRNFSVEDVTNFVVEPGSESELSDFSDKSDDELVAEAPVPEGIVDRDNVHAPESSSTSEATRLAKFI